MAAVGVVKAPSYAPAFSSSRSNDFAAGYASPLSYNSTPKAVSSPGSSKRLPTFTSIKSLRNEQRASSSHSSRQHALRSTLRNIDTRMSSSSTASATSTTPTTAPTATTTRSDSQHARLHKRGSSGSSLPKGAHSQFATPYATYEEPFLDMAATPSTSTPKMKPYLRKISSVGKGDPDQGRLDLSKSVSENEALMGLGIQDFGSRPDSAQNVRRVPHTRTTSVGSTVSTASGSFRPSQPFIHPMRQIPNMPYTPVTDTSSLDEETRESSDVVTDEDVQVGQPAVRPGRSTSLSSTVQQATAAAPTPLSQSHTLADLATPKLTSSSQTNLSIKSSRSLKSLKSKLGGRSRANTNHSSLDHLPTASSRTSLDNAFSFVSRRSDLTDTQQTRDERIRAARRKFEAKEANKDRRVEKEELRRRQSEYARNVKRQQRRESEASSSERPRMPKVKSKRDLRGSGELRTMKYDDNPVSVTALPRQGTEPGKSEKGDREPVARQQRRGEQASPGEWTRFSTWLQTRLLSCGGKGS